MCPNVGTLVQHIVSAAMKVNLVVSALWVKVLRCILQVRTHSAKVLSE